MNLPVDEIKEQNLSLKDMNIKKKLVSLLEKKFSGYAILTIDGRSGIEEGALLFRDGEAIGAVFEYLRFGRSLFGDAALLHFLNASKAEFGILDIIGLNSQQIELIIAFNEKIELNKPVSAKDLAKIVPDKYNPKFAENELKSELSKKESKFDIFKKIGLDDFSSKFE